MMQNIRSILAVVDRDERSRWLPAKAAGLARLTKARLELFLCDAERAYVRQHQYDRQAAAQAKESCLADSRQYLQALSHRLAIGDVEISLSVGCESPLYAGIVHAVEQDRPDLVVRGVGTDDTGDAGGATSHGRQGRAAAGGSVSVAPLEANDWLLVSACPSPLLLTRGKSWKERPIIAAAVDVSSGETADLTRTILRAAAEFAKSTGGALEVVHACPPGRPQAEIEMHRATLAERVREAGVESARIHLVVGEPAAALREFAKRESVDLIVLGALTHRKTLAALVGTLTGRLIDTLDTDFLLLKRSHCPS